VRQDIQKQTNLEETEIAKPGNSGHS